MNILHSITCILLMSLCNVEWIQTKREAVVLEGDELAKMIFNSTKPSPHYNCVGEHLSLKENNINQISRDSFGNLTNLCEIDLESNKIKSIDPNAFSAFVYLKRLFLSKNDIKIIQSDLFKCNHRIKKLLLDHNRISVIEKDAFKNLIQLSDLDLTGNPVKQLESGIFSNNINLSILELSNIQLKEVNEKLFQNLVELNILDLSDNVIVNISENLFNNNIKLHHMYLNGNRITHVPKRMFHNLKKVWFLNLESNNISELNEECFNNMSSLSELYLNNNKIKSLPQNLFIKNSKLYTLDINNNIIKNLPKGLFQYNGGLFKLSLHHNQLSEITKENFETTVSLSELNMAHNKIIRLDALSFDNTQLKYLDLQFNEIADLPNEIFHKVNQSLEILLLNNNKLQTIHEDVFSVGMGRILILSLGHNKLINCRFFRFQYFPVLIDLYLNNNKLRDVNDILSEVYMDVFVETKVQNLFLEFNEIELGDEKLYIASWELRFLNLSNNKITRLECEFYSNHLQSLIVDVRNNRILEAYWNIEEQEVIRLGSGRLYLFESVIPISNVNQIKSLVYYGHEKIFKLKKIYFTVSAAFREIEEIDCEDDLIIVNLEIHKNHLQRIDCLSEVWTLHFIDFSYNELTTLKKEYFAKMIYLETLDISHNQLTSLDLKVIAASTKLTEFYFDRCEVVYSWQYYRITEMFPNLTHISMQNNSIYCPLLSTIIQKFQNFNITIRDYKRDDSIVFDRVHGISCEDYQSLKEILILIMYCINFLITTVIISVLSIIHHRNNFRIK